MFFASDGFIIRGFCILCLGAKPLSVLQENRRPLRTKNYFGLNLTIHLCHCFYDTAGKLKKLKAKMLIYDRYFKLSSNRQERVKWMSIFLMLPLNRWKLSFL